MDDKNELTAQKKYRKYEQKPSYLSEQRMQSTTRTDFIYQLNEVVRVRRDYAHAPTNKQHRHNKVSLSDGGVRRRRLQRAQRR